MRASTNLRQFGEFGHAADHCGPRFTGAATDSHGHLQRKPQGVIPTCDRTVSRHIRKKPPTSTSGVCSRFTAGAVGVDAPGLSECGLLLGMDSPFVRWGVLALRA